MNLFPHLENNDQNKILLFAHDKFIREGFQKVSMDEIASELSMSKKTIYKYFDSKDILISSVCDLRIDAIKSKIEQILELDSDCISKFELIGEMHANFTKDCSQNFIKDLKIHAPELRIKFEEFGEEYTAKVFGKLLDQGKKENLIDPKYPNSIVVEIFNASMMCSKNPDFLITNGLSMKETFEFVTDILFTGLLSSEGRKRYKQNSKKISQQIEYS
ncbi:MAG TPA: TetR/AcrR family transcriptional regulator [Ignavibacteria bacterium]|nr:TetR/AcrR family transcriptional regulator [Ignavibacteria bacterium]